MYKRYWVQADAKSTRDDGMFKVILKTNDLQKAIKKMKRTYQDCFIWDCNERNVVDINYRTKKGGLI